MEKPPPPPAATLIRLVREAAGLKIPTVAKRAGISPARWSQIENGYEVRQERVKAVNSRAVTLAHMAAAVALSPERLETEGERPDAAVILREIIRQEKESQQEPADDRPGIVRQYWDDPDYGPMVRALWNAPHPYPDVKLDLIVGNLKRLAAEQRRRA